MTILGFLAATSVFYLIAPTYIHAFFLWSPSGAAVISMAFFFSLNYYHFLHKNKFHAVINMFDDESRVQRIIGGILTIMFALVLILAAVHLKFLARSTDTISAN